MQSNHNLTAYPTCEQLKILVQLKLDKIYYIVSHFYFYNKL